MLFYYLMECVHAALKMEATARPAAPEATAASRLAASFLALLGRQFPIVSPAQRLELRTAQAFADRLAVHVNSLNRSLKAATGKTTSQLLAQRVVQEGPRPAAAHRLAGKCYRARAGLRRADAFHPLFQAARALHALGSAPGLISVSSGLKVVNQPG